MAAHTLTSALETGTAKVEYVFHVGGMPWAVHTSGLTSISSAYRRQMFGDEWYGVAKYYANDVSLYPHLQTPGAQTVTMKDGVGTLDGGAWTAEILDLPAGDSTFPHNQRTNIVGLEGVSAMANPRQDPTIGHADLWTAFGKAATTLSIDNDFADIIHDGITAKGGDPYLLWIGGECVAATAEAAGSGYALDLTVAGGERGLFRSKKQSHHPRSVNTSAPIKVCSAPLNGIAARPYYLWAILVDDDGTPIDDPHLLRHGKVGQQVSYQPGRSMWNVQCLPWWKWLDTDIHIDAFEGHLAKFTFSRPKDGGDTPPHMQLREWDSGAWGDTLDIWLCGDGSADAVVTYDTIEELFNAIGDACTAASTADGTNDYVYDCSPVGPWSEDGPSSPVDQRPQIRGPLVGICSFGYSGPVLDGIEEWVAEHRHAGNPKNHRWWGFDFEEADDSANGGWIPTRDASSMTTFGNSPRYVYQWFEAEAETDYDDDESELGKLWPVPQVGGAARMWLDNEADCTSFAAGDELTIGTEDFWLQLGWGLFRTSLSKGYVKDKGTGPPANNYVELGDDVPDFPNWGTGDHPVLMGQKADAGDDNDDKIFGRSCYLYYRPNLHATDPWPVKQNFDVITDKPSTIFKALLGDTSEITIPEATQVDHIPDSLSLGLSHPTIDWDSLDEYIESSSSGFDGMSFRMRYNGRINIWQLFLNLLRFWGLTPTYEWVQAQKMYRVRFREVGTINSTLAVLGGRKLDSTRISRGTKITTKHSSDWLVNSADVSMWWDYQAGEFAHKYQFGDSSGFAPTGGKRNTIKVEDRITRIDPSVGDNEAALITHFAVILDSTMTPHPTQTVRATVDKVLSFGVGVESLVTVDGAKNPYGGVVGMTDWAALITSMTCDPSAGTTGYTYRLAATNAKGWAPTCRITASTVDDADKVSVTGISLDGDGQEWCGTGETDGWYDHWFFTNAEFNSSMDAPTYSTGSAITCPVVLWTIEDATPVYITGVTCTAVSLSTWATINGAGGDFFELTGSGWTGSWDVAKDWYMTFADFDHASLPDFAKEYIFIADTDGTITDSAAAVFAGEEWK
ncbi:MAG: hypothetical protein GY851_09255 [bacterium]|nr:hypothetical protein [bacterium]